MAKWMVKKESANIELMAKTLEISEIMAQVLVNRKIRTKKTALRFLYPELSDLNINPIKDMQKAVDLIRKAINQQKKIAIYGDYDADGVTSVVILYKALKACDGDVMYYVPHREEEGYGLNMEAICKLHEENVELLLCCDNGIVALEEVKKAKELGMTVVIIDHHEPGFVESTTGTKLDVLPLADAIVDPKQQDCSYPFKMMCAAGLSYRFAIELLARSNMYDELHDELLVFAMISTFCDIVDLKDDNRIITKKGLEILNDNKEINLGLWALLQKRGYDEKTVDEFSIGFVIGPCINAAGRLESAKTAIELFLTEDLDEAEDLADILVELNTKRKELTSDAVDRLLAEINTKQEQDKILVIYDPHIHESVAGIVAGRIKETLFRPTIVLTKNGDFAKGSARSIEVYNIFEELFKCRELFERFGGHAMAAGLTLKEDNIEKLRELLNTNCRLTDEDFVEIIRIDRGLPLQAVTYELAQELKLLSPCGKDNKEPLFGVRGVIPEEIRIIEDKNTIIFVFPIDGTYRRMKGISFGMVNAFKKMISEHYDEYDTDKIMHGILRGANLKLDLVYAPDINEYNGNISVQIRIKDFRISL